MIIHIEPGNAHLPSEDYFGQHNPTQRMRDELKSRSYRDKSLDFDPAAPEVDGLFVDQIDIVGPRDFKLKDAIPKKPYLE
mgnify:CR=1 FL=1